MAGVEPRAGGRPARKSLTNLPAQPKGFFECRFLCYVGVPRLPRPLKLEGFDVERQLRKPLQVHTARWELTGQMALWRLDVVRAIKT